MAIAAEHLYESCTCDAGMRNGLRCADCNGRGIVPKGYKPTGAAIVEETDAVEDDGLDDMSITHLRSRAKDLGLSAGGSKAALVKSIREANAAATEDELHSGAAARLDDAAEAAAETSDSVDATDGPDAHS